jgi:ABC-type spermidine/putrescine transport system permease subunit I
MTYPKIKKPVWLSSLVEIPLHMRFTAVTALVSLVIFFLPSVTLTLMTVPRLNLSFFQILQNGQILLLISDSKYWLTFSKAFPVLILCLILPLILLALVFFYRRIADKFSGRAVAGAAFLLLIGNLISLFMVPTLLVSSSILTQAGISSADLFFAPGTIGNLDIILLILGLCAAAFGALGLKMRLRMLSYPYLIWLVVFTILPLLLILFTAFFAKDASGSYSFTLDGFQTLLVPRVIEARFYGLNLHLQEYFSVFLRSLDYAAWTTVGCLFVAYPLAYALADRAKRMHTSSSLLLMFFVLPMWINTMLRTYAWRAFFGQFGVLNNMLLSLHWISVPILFLKLDFLSDFIIKLVLVNDFLPFMLLPIYSVLVKLDENVRQAAHDLGANSRQTFSRVIFPLSMPGVISGIQMVFMPALTFYMIPEIISEGSVTTIGTTVQTFILSESTVQQQAGNVLSLLLLIFVLITMGILRNSDKDTGGGGMIL